MTLDSEGRPIDLDAPGECEFGDCFEPATTFTEEGYRYCTPHARQFYEAVAAIMGASPVSAN